MTREEFYGLRDQRTIEYGVPDQFDQPIMVGVGEGAASTQSGQLAFLSLLNQLARVHRHLIISVPDSSLQIRSLVHADTLKEASLSLASKIDPFIRIEPINRNDQVDSITLSAGKGTPWFLGAVGAVGKLSKTPVEFIDRGFSLGAGIASCLGASAALRESIGRIVVPTFLSAWDLSEGVDAAVGPIINSPLDVGNVLQVGAGGVGSCFDYWLMNLRTTGRWAVMDGDHVTLHNTNRSLGLLAEHAGFDGRQPVLKADVAASLIGAETVSTWFGTSGTSGFRPDLILPLANERNVRYQISMLGEPILLHATTSRNWEAQAHRHIPDRDDCINCRMPPKEGAPQMACSTVRISQNTIASSDAALPFLSAAAGLLLVAQLLRLQHGELVNYRENYWSINFNTVRRYAQYGVWPDCGPNCRSRLNATVRKRVQVGARWSSIDEPASSA